MPPFIAKTLDDMPTQEDVLSRSGLEFMQAVLAGELSGAPIAGTLGFTLTEVEDRRCVFQGRAPVHATNPMRGVHGGWYGALLDSAMGCAVMTCLRKGSYYTTLEYKINITRALPLDMPVVAEARVTHAGRSTSVASGEIRGAADGTLYATGSTTCLIMQAPVP